MRHSSVTPLALAVGVKSADTDSASSSIANPVLRISIFPASILDRSRISASNLFSRSTESLARSTYSDCSASRDVVSMSCSMPMTPLMGVRISWLMLARNSDLAWLAASAASLAFNRASSASFLLVRSTSRQKSSGGLPGFLTMTWLEKTSTLEPSLRMSDSSPAGMGTPVSAMDRMSFCTNSRISGGMIRSTRFFPTASCAVYP